MPGLFDALNFNPSSFDGSGGILSLLSRLSPSAMAQIGQSQGLPEIPGQAPQGGMTDISAQSRAVPQQMPAQQQPQQIPVALNGGGENPLERVSNALRSLGNGGSLGGAISGNYNDSASMSQQQLRAQYQALVPVLGAQKAMLAVLNPEAGKTLLNEALTNKEKYVKIGQDGLGREQYGFVNEREQTVNGKPISQAQPSAGDQAAGLGNMDLTGKEYLSTVPKAQANIIESMVEGKIPPPSSFALSKPYWQNMLAAAKNYDPTFDAADWSARVAGAKDFSAGKSSEMVRSANQTLHHVGALMKSADALNNSSYPMWNTVGNAVSEGMGSGAQTSFRMNAHAVAEELSKVFKGSNLSDAEVHAWEKNLNENMSPDQMRAAVGKAKELLSGALHALEEKRLNAIGPVAAEKAGPLLKQEAQDVLNRMDNWIANGRNTKQELNSAAPDGAIAALKKDPSLAAQFDAKYGAGAAKKVIGH